MLKKFLRCIADILAYPLAWMMRVYVPVPRYFAFWQRHGFHVTPVHFYHPLPDTRSLSNAWEHDNRLLGIDLRESEQVSLAETLHDLYVDEYSVFEHRNRDDLTRFALGRISFESVDAEIYYAMLRYFKPKNVIEVGAGQTTLIALEAIQRNMAENSPGELLSIEPFPKSLLHDIREDFFELKTSPIQDIEVRRFESLKKNDVLFIDSSHVCKIGSDVQLIFSEILPRLANGVLVHFHDIFLPREYPKNWVLRENRFWNEQYLLQAFLAFNYRFEILCAAPFLHARHPDILEKAIPSYDPKTHSPGSFWIRVKS